MNGKQIGKITSAKFGLGGYQDAMIGVSWGLGSDRDSWGVGDFWGAWAIERSSYCKWSEEDRLNEIGKAVMRLNEVLAAAKKDNVSALVGTPIECIFEGNMLKSWRVLTEVI